MASADELLDGPVQSSSADQLLDQGGTSPSIADSLLDGNDSIIDSVKSKVKNVAHAAMMPLRGYEALGVGGAKLLSGSRPQEALARAADATQPGFDPKGIAENVGSFAGGTAPMLALSVLAPESGAPVVALSRAQKLVQAAKVGGLFGSGLSTVESLEKHGTISMDDAEHIAMSGILNATIGLTAEAVLGPIISRVLKSKTPIVENAKVEVKPEIVKSEYTPSAAAMKARKQLDTSELGQVKAANETDLADLVKTRDQMKSHGEALAPEAKLMLDDIEKEVERLHKLDKTYTTKQMVKELGIDLTEQTPAKAEEIMVRASKPDFVVAMKSEKGQVVGEPGMIHGMLDNPGGKNVEAGYVDRNTGKFYTRAEAAKAINPEGPVGDALHSKKLKDLAEMDKMSPEELRQEQIKISEQRNKIYKEVAPKYKTAAEANEAVNKMPEYRALQDADYKLHELMADDQASKETVAKIKDLIPAVSTKDGIIEGKPGMEHDDIIAKNNLDIVADNVIEGYKRVDDGSFVKKEDILGKATTETKNNKFAERMRAINQWAEENAQEAKAKGFKTTEEALAWAEKEHRYLPPDYKLAFQNKYASLTKAAGKVPPVIPPSKASISATPIEVGESAPILKASEMKIQLDDIKQLPPAAGANSEVADVIDSARANSIGKKPKVELTSDGKTFTTFRDDAIKIVQHEVPNENQIKIKQDTAASPAVAELKIPKGILKSSPNLPGTENAPAFIPEYIAGSSNFRQGWYARVAKQTRTVLNGMGDAGKEMAARMAMVDDASSIRSANFLYNFDQLITQIPKSQREKAGMALMDILEGRPNSTKLPAGMTELVQKMFGDFADDAKALDFYILRADGTKVAWAERANFAPRMVKSEFIDGILRGDTATLGRVKQYFLETKQASTEYQASQKAVALRRRYMERRYGHLERAREYDLPPEFYERQGFAVIPEYVRAASHRLEEVRQFGQHDSRISELLDKISGEGNDAVLARQIFDRYAGLEVADEVHSRLVSGIKNLVTGMSIQLPSTITQLGQVMTPIHRVTSPEIGLGLAKAYGRAAGALIKSFTVLGKEEAARAGQGFESVATDYLLDTYGGTRSKPFAKFAEKALEYSGFSAEDSFWRRFSAILGKNHIQDELVPRILKNGSDKYAVAELRRLGLNPSIVKAQGGLSDFELNLATKRFADQTQGAPNVLDLPLWWSSPTGKFMTQFHTFSVVIGKENYLLAKDMIKTGNINRLISMGVGTPLVGAGISYMKEDILGLKPTDFTGNSDADKVIRWYMNGTSFGVAADLMLNLVRGRNAFVKSAQPAALGILSGLGYDTKAALLEGDKKAAKRVAQKIPVVGRVLFQ